MPTLPMYSIPPHPDGWHAVTSPGGYEWWYFDAEDRGGEWRFVGILFQGFVFHPGYLRAYERYRRHPTRNHPPTPSQYPCGYFVVYKGDRIHSQFMRQYQPGDFAAAVDGVDVTAGPNRVMTGADGLSLYLMGTPWKLTGRGPRLLTDSALSGAVRFRPRFEHPAMERTFLSPTWSGAEHRWVIANPLCDVAGEIEIKTGSATERVAFDGRGYHDHNFGTGPIGPGLRRWMWGRVIADDHVIVFHLAEPVDGPREVHLVEADGFGCREIPASADVRWSRRSTTWLAFPSAVSIGPLTLSNPRVVDDSPFYLRLAYDSSVRGVAGTAFCELAYPHRLRWPVLGRMIGMSIS